MMKAILLGLVLMTSFSIQAKTRMFTVVNHQFEGTKQWLPGTLIVNVGDDVEIMLVNNAPSGVHNFSIPAFDINQNVMKGKPATINLRPLRPVFMTSSVVCIRHTLVVSSSLTNRFKLFRTF